MQHNNVRIYGGRIMSKKHKPLVLGDVDDVKRISEIYSRNVDILGTLDVTTKKDTPPVLSISDDTVFINSENIILESNNVDIQGSLSVNGLSTTQNSKSMYKLHHITNESHTIKLDDSKFDVFECNIDSIVTLEMELDDDFVVLEKVLLLERVLRVLLNLNLVNYALRRTFRLGLVKVDRVYQWYVYGIN